MNDLILITAFCDNSKKENYLRNLVNNLKENSNYDILISSHSVLPKDILELVDYYIYDKKNILLTDFELRNTAWFDPDGNGPINSIFTGFYNTHLAVWRLMILGNSLAKNLGYEKVHHIEYDTEISNFNELDDNSNLLENYEYIFYNIQEGNKDEILLGSFQSYLLSKLDSILIEYQEEKILNMIRKSYRKSPEIFLMRIIEEKNIYLKKNIPQMNVNGMKFGLSEEIKNHVAWCLPYYEPKTNKLMFIVWNMEKQENLNVEIIYNKEKVFNFENIKPNEWRLLELGNYDDSKKLIVIINDKIRNVYNFEDYFHEFKLNSYRES